MRSMFWFPLAGGMALAMLFYKLERTVSRKSFLLWNSGIATLTAGCPVRGIITISGRSSAYDRYYWFVGVVFLLWVCGNELWGTHQRKCRRKLPG